MLDRCPGCGKEVKESDDICPHCKRDFSAPIQKKKPAEKQAEPGGAKTLPPRSEPRLAPPASLDEPRLSPPASLEEDVLESLDSFEGSQRSGSEPVTIIKEPPKGSAMPYVVAVLICGGGLYYTQVVNKPARKAPAAVVEEKPAPPPKPPETPTPAQAAAVPKAGADPASAIPEDQPPPEDDTLPVKKPRTGKKRRPAQPARQDEPVFVENSVYGRAGPDIDAPPASDAAPVAGATEFRVRGSVFELLTLRPVAEADIVFTNLETGRRLSTESGADGSFRAQLPLSDRGYSLAIRHPKFEPSYIVDEEQNFKKLPADQRKEIAATRARTLADSQNLNGVAGRILKRDFALVPVLR